MAKKLRVWLDDVRPTPVGWVGTKYIEKVKRLLLTGDVEDLSLDNDLGREDPCASCYDEACPVVIDPDDGVCGHDCHAMLPEGYLLVDWMEKTGHWPVNKPKVHSANTFRATYMRKAIDRHYDRRAK